MNNTIRKPWILGIFLLVSCLLLIAGAQLAWFAFTPLRASSGDILEQDNAQIIPLRKGTSPNDLTKELISKGIIVDGRSFIFLGRIIRGWKNLKAGEYRVSSSMSPIEILRTFTSGISIAYPITVREGENMYEIADDLAKNGLAKRDEFLDLCTNPEFILSLGNFSAPLPPSLEGYLFPDTYHFSRTQTPQEIVRQMVKHFFSIWNNGDDLAAKSIGMTRHQVVTLASMIEKETGAAEERPLISSVFHNRLKNRMRLQSDPTTIYGIWKTYTGNISKKDLATKNPYNTYHVDTLPIGPIANPGKESLQAALHPSESSFFYFVSHNDGTHQFSRTIDEHNQAVRKYQLAPHAREGKSWRDQLKKAPASVSNEKPSDRRFSRH